MVSCYDIAQDALRIQAEGCGYIWGTSGEVWTLNKQKDLEDLYTLDPAKYHDRFGSYKYGAKWIGKHVYDCSGLVMRILANHGVSVAHGSNSQYSNHCKAKGKLCGHERDDGKELRPGTAVFKYRESDGNRYHVGIYVGSGQVVEAKGGKDGVVISKVTAWHEWGELKRVDYKAQDPGDQDPGGGSQMETVRKGDRGAAVTALQQALVRLGYGVTADGIFGGETQTVVKAFQKKNGLDDDGVCGPLTWAALLSESGMDPSDKDDGKESGEAVFVTIRLRKDLADALRQALNDAEVIS